MEAGSNENGDGIFDFNDDDDDDLVESRDGWRLDAPFANSRSFSSSSSSSIGNTGKNRGIRTHSSPTSFPSCAIATSPPPSFTGVAIDVDFVALVVGVIVIDPPAADDKPYASILRATSLVLAATSSFPSLPGWDGPSGRGSVEGSQNLSLFWNRFSEFVS